MVIIIATTKQKSTNRNDYDSAVKNGSSCDNLTIVIIVIITRKIIMII